MPILWLKTLPVSRSSLYVSGRNDLSVPFFGCKVFPTDLDHIIHQDTRLAKHLNSFQIQNVEDAEFNRLLHLHLEQAEGSTETLGDLHDLFHEGWLGSTRISVR